MATQTLSPGDATAFDSLEIVSTDATELGEDFETDRDCILRGVKYEFAAGVVYTIKLRPSSTGPDVVLKTGTAVAGGDTGIVASGHALSQGGRINVVTTGAISGNKKVSVEVSPAQVGA